MDGRLPRRIPAQTGPEDIAEDGTPSTETGSTPVRSTTALTTTVRSSYLGVPAFPLPSSVRSGAHGDAGQVGDGPRCRETEGK